MLLNLCAIASSALASFTLVSAARHDNAAPHDAACDALVAGEAAQKTCENLVTTFKSKSAGQIKDAFAYYYPEGSNPTLDELAASYPKGVVPADLKLKPILDALRPDYNAIGDFGYGKSNGRAAKNGPEGGLPAFCRFGASIITSPLTSVLAEVWLPLASDPAIPLPIQNVTAAEKPGADDKVAGDDKPPAGDDKPAPAADNQPKADDKSTPDAPTSKESANADTGVAANKSTAEAKPAAAEKQQVMPMGGEKQQAMPDKTDKQSTDKTSTTADDAKASADQSKPSSKLQRRSQRVMAGDEVLGACPGWNGRLLHMLNGGQRGWVPHNNMKQTMARYHFTLAGSNAGHFSGTGATEWIAGPDRKETLADFGGRATHVTQAFAHDVIDQFYGTKAGVRTGSRVRSYLAGASVGGGAALSSVQNYPNDFDAVMSSAATVDFNALNAGQIHTQSVNNKNFSGDGWFDKKILAGPGHEVILEQCDELDGVKDRVVSLPRLCKPRFEDDMLCGKEGAKYGGSNETCLTQAQINNLYRIYEPTVLDDVEVYPAYLPGFEQDLISLIGEARKACGFVQVAVLGKEEIDDDFDCFRAITREIVEMGDRNPDLVNINAKNPDISAFINKGGVLLQAHGLADLVVSPLRASQYYEDVVRVTTPKLNGKSLSDSYRYFEIPGMSHSRGGDGPWHLGLVTQVGYGNRPFKYDTQHDVLLALVAWKEHGIIPEVQIGATYKDNTFEKFENTRRLCPFPSYAAYLGGSTMGEDAWNSFACKQTSSISINGARASVEASISINL